MLVLVLSYFLASIVGGHAFATRGVSLILGKPVNFEYVAHSLEIAPPLFHIYYTLFGASALFHGSYGMLRAASIFKIQIPEAIKPTKPLFWGLLGVGLAGIISTVFFISQKKKMLNFE
jgi:hypothetical protein